jgi:hypothetical protein
VDIARAFGFDCVHFQMIRNWGTFTVAEFDGHFIGSPDHPATASSWTCCGIHS